MINLKSIIYFKREERDCLSFSLVLITFLATPHMIKYNQFRRTAFHDFFKLFHESIDTTGTSDSKSGKLPCMRERFFIDMKICPRFVARFMVCTTSDKQISGTFQGFLKDKLQFP